MKLRSFRLRLGLLSVGLSGMVLFGFTLYATSVIQRVGINRIDRELRALADAQIRREHPRDHWSQLDRSLRAQLVPSGEPALLVLVTDRDGDLVFQSPAWPESLSTDRLPLPLDQAPEAWLEAPPPIRRGDGGPPPDRRPPPDMFVRGPVYETIGDRTSRWRLMTIANEIVTFTLAMNLDVVQVEIDQFWSRMLLAAPLCLLLLAVGGWVIGQTALRPINRMASTAEAMTAQRLDARISTSGSDMEFARLIQVFNQMLERLEAGFRQATRFSADAAHELKTPLAILQAQMERSLQQAEHGSQEQRTCAEQLEEVQRIKVILHKLLLLSQADAGVLPITPEPVHLADLLRDAAEDASLIAPNRSVSLSLPEEIVVHGDRALIAQAIENLLTNAINYGDPEGTITLALTAHADRALISVVNTGPPIPPAERAHIFDRFHRGDSSRSRRVDGFGLGLSLAREIARAHGGTLNLTRSDEESTQFTLILPRHPA
ncbi:MAG: HAMP domain-containing protein [Kiritimatiellae bacterium]|nr:HAMP domain-containing protein [Kiritimatiellia bacterium]